MPENTTTEQFTPAEQRLLAAMKAQNEEQLAPVLALAKTKAGPGFTPPGADANQPVTSDAKDLQLDVAPGMEMVARMGWRAKRKYLDRANAMGVTDSWVKSMKADMDRMEKAAKSGYLSTVGKAGQFLSNFQEGGAIWAKETVSGELIEFLRAASIILSLPGLRTVSGYGGKLTYSRQNTSATGEWSGEGASATASSITFGDVILGAHKWTGRVPISNDIMRLGTGDASVTVGLDLRAAAGEALDDACLNGQGAGKPTGLYVLTDSSHKVGIAGTSIQNKVDDTLALPRLLEDAFIPGHGEGVYLMGTTTFYGLAGQRGTDAYTFEGLRNLANPTLHGRPVLRSTKLKTIGDSGAAVIGYVQPMHCVFGESHPMEVAMGESGDDFAKDMMTARIIMYGDFGMRYRKAAAWKKNVSY
jgi:HK97 family phage major capsid protein